jgi:hypothetical protein
MTVQITGFEVLHGDSATVATLNEFRQPQLKSASGDTTFMVVSRMPPGS